LLCWVGSPFCSFRRDSGSRGPIETLEKKEEVFGRGPRAIRPSSSLLAILWGSLVALCSSKVGMTVGGVPAALANIRTGFTAARAGFAVILQ
jgi:hypothetical protein